MKYKKMHKGQALKEKHLEQIWQGASILIIQ